MDITIVMQKFETWALQFDKVVEKVNNPMSESTSIAFMQLAMVDMKTPDAPMPEQLLGQGMVQIAMSRAEWMQLNITPRVIVFLCFMFPSPGSIVMLLSYMKRCALRDNCNLVNMQYLSEIFPLGFPVDDDMHALWDAQKVSRDEYVSDNLLDCLKF